ncbi:hypothetical protein BaRGS_00023137 [Batillaria attramentaria]|uniref:Uncharacterized protein n=1 Tax=Batillaria attramentaria TaxID=370345 RepID=A0ABD0KFB1_9CAEN
MVGRSCRPNPNSKKSDRHVRTSCVTGHQVIKLRFAPVWQCEMVPERVLAGNTVGGQGTTHFASHATRFRHLTATITPASLLGHLVLRPSVSTFVI